MEKKYFELELDKTKPEDRNAEQQEGFEIIVEELRAL